MGSVGTGSVPVTVRKSQGEGLGAPEKGVAWKRLWVRKAKGGLPGGAGVKTLGPHCRGHRFNPWSGKFHLPYSTAKKKKKRERERKEKAGEERTQSEGAGVEGRPGY